MVRWVKTFGFPVSMFVTVICLGNQVTIFDGVWCISEWKRENYSKSSVATDFTGLDGPDFGSIGWDSDSSELTDSIIFLDFLSNIHT